MQPTTLWLRGTVVLGACAAVAVLGWGITAQPVADVLGPVVQRGPGALRTLRFDTLVVGLAALLLLGCAGWLALTTAVATTLELARQLAPGALAVRLLELLVDRWSPALVRRAVATVVGTAVTAGLAVGPALAAPGRGHDIDGLALPDRTTGSAGPAGARPAAAPLTTPRRGEVVVRPGDCLWSIAAGRLPAAASDADVVAAVHRLASANPDRIGPDPDLILPGTHLVVPDLTGHPTAHREEAP